MECKCCVFGIQGIGYLSQCEECKKQKKSINIINITNQTNQIPVKYKFKWYEFHIQLIRDYPEIRLGIELFCLTAISVWIICAYLDYTKLYNFKYQCLINKIICGFLMSSIIIIFGYLDAIDKLARNKKFGLC